MTILCVGEDTHLLAYRASVLETTGAKVKITSGDPAPIVIEQEQFDLIVVGHSVSEESARAVYEAAKAQRPSPIVLRLRSWISGTDPDGMKYADAVSNADPPILVQIAAELLKRKRE